MRYLVICSVKNEGPYLVEWVSWYRSLGFTDILVLSNDCSDHSPQLLDALQAAGWLTHVPVTVPEGQMPTATKLEVARQHPLLREVDWVFICDVDEFLVVHAGDGKVADLVRPGQGEGFVGMALNWRCFGTSGHEHWADELVHRRFTRAAREDADSGRWIKSIFTRPWIFRRFAEHGPCKMEADAWHALQVAGQPAWVNSAGQPLPQWQSDGVYLRMMKHPQVSYARAQLNHYITRDRTSFWLKKGVRSGTSGKDRYTEEFFRNFNRNEVVDDCAVRRAAVFDPVHQAALALPGVRELHQACCDDLRERIRAKRAQIASVHPSDTLDPPPSVY